MRGDGNTDGCIFGASRYMGQYTTPVTAVLEAYVLISFLIFFVMFMLCVHRHGCCVSISFTSFLSSSAALFVLFVLLIFKHSTSFTAEDVVIVKELCGINNRCESGLGRKNKQTVYMMTMTKMKISMVMKSTVSTRKMVIVCRRFRGWKRR